MRKRRRGAPGATPGATTGTRWRQKEQYNRALVHTLLSALHNENDERGGDALMEPVPVVEPLPDVEPVNDERGELERIRRALMAPEPVPDVVVRYACDDGECELRFLGSSLARLDPVSLLSGRFVAKLLRAVQRQLGTIDGARLVVSDGSTLRTDDETVTMATTLARHEHRGEVVLWLRGV